MILKGKVKTYKQARDIGGDTFQIVDYDKDKGYNIQACYKSLNSGFLIITNMIKPKEINQELIESKFVMLDNINSLNLETGEFGYKLSVETRQNPTIEFKFVNVIELT